MSPREIDDVRAEIDELDQELIGLLSRRLQLVREIGSRKRSQGLQVHDPVREEEILARIDEEASEDPAVLRGLFARLIAEFRRVESAGP